MASESANDESLSVTVPPALAEWLDAEATARGVPPSEVVVQLLSSYQASTEPDPDYQDALEDALDVEDAVEGALQDELAATVAATVDEKLEDAVADSLSDRLPDIADAVEGRLDDRFEALDSEFQAKIEDVRERVIQLKRELETKADDDHSHPELAVDDLRADVSSLESAVEALETALEDIPTETAEELEVVDERLAETEERLERVAWVVSDLREDQGRSSSHEQAVDRIKRAAAQEGLTVANCENCGERVDLGLLTAPQCPHCDATVSDVRPEGGIFRTKARLLTASQLESGAGDG